MLIPIKEQVESLFGAINRFPPLKSGPFDKLRFYEMVWMFDNEIDWVTRLECRSAAVRRDGWRYFQTRLNTRPSTCELVQVTNSGKCSSKKSVFRSATRERVSVASCSQADLYTG